MSADIMEMFWQAPPVARTIAAATFACSVVVHFGILSYYYFIFDLGFLTQLPPQVWRFATCFLVSHPKLSIVLDPYFLFQALRELEVGNSRFSRREDLIWYLVFIAASIITLNKVLFDTGGFYLSGLILALTYTGRQDQRGLKANFFFVTIPAQLVPYSMILVDVLMNGPFVLPGLICGLLSAHLYDFLARTWPEFGGGPNLLATPSFVSRLVGTASGPAGATFGRSFRGTGQTAGSSSGSAAGSGPLPDSWKTRGRGQRLGSD